jgi:predicted nucleotidyltransferase
MSAMHTELSDRLSEVGGVCQRYGVVRLETFGSAARGFDFDPDRSDADFLVEFDPAAQLAPLDQFFGLAEALERLLGRPVDLVEAGAIRNPYVLADINRARELVYAA